MASNPKVLAEITEELKHLNDKLDRLFDSSSTTTILRGNLREEVWFTSGQIDGYAKLGAISPDERQRYDRQLRQLLDEMKAGNL